MKSFIKEFKEFISKGDAMSMAVGIIIGGAFTAIVTSVVDDLIGPQGDQRFTEEIRLNVRYYSGRQ